MVVLLFYFMFCFFCFFLTWLKTASLFLTLISQRSKLNKKKRSALNFFFISPQEHRTSANITELCVKFESMVYCLDHKGIPVAEMLIDLVDGELGPTSSMAWVGPCHQTQRACRRIVIPSHFAPVLICLSFISPESCRPLLYSMVLLVLPLLKCVCILCHQIYVYLSVHFFFYILLIINWGCSVVKMII